jgi:hypothetical protein
MEAAMSDDDFLPPRDHNQPPEPLFIRADELVSNCNRWLKERPVITDDDMAGAAQDFMGQLRRLRDALEAQHKERREPLDLALAALRIQFRQPLELIGIALNKMGALLTPFLQAKEARLKAEAERRQREADEAQQAAERALDKAMQTGTVEDELALQRAAETAEDAAKLAGRRPARAQVRGDYSPRAASLTTYWSAEIVDEAKALEHFKDSKEVHDAALVAITKIGNRMARHFKDAKHSPPGLVFKQRTVAK